MLHLLWCCLVSLSSVKLFVYMVANFHRLCRLLSGATLPEGRFLFPGPGKMAQMYPNMGLDPTHHSHTNGQLMPTFVR